jgi:P27 family predicted phage terminase small subunit
MPKRGPKTRGKRVIPLHQSWSAGARGLTAAAKKHFDATVELLTTRGTLDRTDVQLVRTLAINLELRDVAYDQLQQDGAFVTSDRGNQSAHPAEKVIGAATMRITRILAELELTPASVKGASAASAGGSAYNAWKARTGG